MRWIFTITGLAALAAGQSPPDYTFTTQSELVVLDVGVSNEKGQNLAHLTKDHFRVFDNGKLQTITQFSNEDRPVAAVLAVDSSGSMAVKRPDVLNGALHFIHASNPLDEISIADFNDRVHFRLPLSLPFSSDPSILREALLSIRMEGKTALYDAVYESLLQLKSSGEERKTLVVISDGGDNSSKHNLQDVIAAARESPATIYAVGVFDAGDPDRNPGLLRNLARISGGQAFFPHDVSEIMAICREIADHIRSRYTIGYRPVRLSDRAEQRSIRVAVVGEGKVKVRVRTSYYLPPQSSE